jgi:hypothetical protein
MLDERGCVTTSNRTFDGGGPSRTLRCNDCAVDQMDVQGNLKYLLNEWDPIGVTDTVPDE